MKHKFYLSRICSHASETLKPYSCMFLCLSFVVRETCIWLCVYADIMLSVRNCLNVGEEK